MKILKLKMRVRRDQCAYFPDPVRPKLNKRISGETIFKVRFEDLLEALPYEPNPRLPDIHTKVARKISNSLFDHPDIFHILSLGIYIIVAKLLYNRNEELLTFWLGPGHGIANGGHNHAVINEVKLILKRMTKEERELPEHQAILNSYVKVSMFENLAPGVLNLAVEAWNNGKSNTANALASLRGELDPIKMALANSNIGDLIQYRDQDSSRPVGNKEVLQILCCFHPADELDHPYIQAYNSPGKCLVRFIKDPVSFNPLLPILTDLLKLSDYIRLKFPAMFDDNGRRSLEKHFQELDRNGKPKKSRFIGQFRLYFIDEQTRFDVHNGYIIPILSSLRVALDTRDVVAKWKTDPRALFDRVGHKLVDFAHTFYMEQAGQSFDTLGKKKGSWIGLRNIVEEELTRERKLRVVELPRTEQSENASAVSTA